MNDRVETMLYANVARDLKQRFGARAVAIADEARESLAEIGDEAGEEIWLNITYALNRMDSGGASALLH
ncbi:MAG: hypothetical protein AAF607_06865 [Pseudomonadota bacterium]